MAPLRPLLLRVKWPRTTVAAKLNSYFACILLLAGTVHALDPNKRLTQYMHTSWRVQDGSAPAGMYTVAQTSDGFLWFSAFSQRMYRFDGVRFVPSLLPSTGHSTHRVFKVFGDHAGGLWAEGKLGIIHLKGGVVSSDLNWKVFRRFKT